jgi:hypothetical protein
MCASRACRVCEPVQHWNKRSAQGSICMAHRLRLLAFLAVVSAIALQLPANPARSAEPASRGAPTSGPSRETPSTLDTVITQARRDRELKRQITKFVSGGVVTYFNDSLERWNQPICRLLAGLPSKPAEFIRARESQVARDSHAPLGAEHCKPNLIVVITNDPDASLEKWYKRVRACSTPATVWGRSKNSCTLANPYASFTTQNSSRPAGRA